MLNEIKLDKTQFKVVQETFGSHDIYMESLEASKNGNDKFVASDGISYIIPDFMRVAQSAPTPAVKEYQPAPESSETVPWYRDAEGGIELSNYVEPKEPAKLSEDQTDLVYEDQVGNEALMDSLRRRHGNKSTQELLELWAGEQHFINYNVTALAYDAATLESMTRQEKIDYLMQMQTWDRVKAFGDGSQGFWDQLWEIGKALGSDVTTYVGIGTLGAGLLARQGTKEASKLAIMSYLKESTKQAIKTGGKIGLVEGTAYGLADSVLHQTIEQKATEQITDMSDVQLDAKRTTIDTILGGVAGATLGGSISGGVSSFRSRSNSGEKAADILDDLGASAEEGALHPDTELKVEANTPEVTPGDAPEATIPNYTAEYTQLPPNLRKGRPHYGKAPVTFENDLQRALFLAGSKKQGSKHFESYVQFAMDSLGRSREDVIKLGRALHVQVGEALAGRTGDETAPIHTDFSYFKMGEKVDEVVSQQGKAVSKVEGEETTVEVDGEVTDVATTKNAQGQTQYPPMKTTDEQESLAQSMSKVEGETLPTKPKDGAPINLERTQVYDEDTSQAILDNYRLSSGVVLNADTEKAARTKLMSFRTVEDIRKFLETYSNKIEGLEVDATVVRMLYSSEANKVAKAWSGAKTKSERMNILANNPALLQSLRAITIMVQRSGTAAGRVLQSQKIDVKEFNKVLSNIAESAQVIRKVTDQARADGKDVDVAIKEAFSDKDMDSLMTEMDNLIQITADHNDHVRRALPAFNRTEHIFKKIERIATEIWLSGNLSSLSTQYGALAGSVLKRSTIKGEAYLRWSIGKTFNMKNRLKWNEMQALNEANYAQSLSTLKMMFRMMKGGTGEGAEGIMQREALDGWNTKWDDETTHGAINSGYLGFEDPNTLFKSIVNKTLDVGGNVIRSPFSALTLADDIMKRVYYLPHIKYQLTKEANTKFPGKDQSALHQNHIIGGLEAYEIFYIKKGDRLNTMKRHVFGEMEKFKKDNPDATYDEIQVAEHDALADAEKLVEFTVKENDMIKAFGIDDIKHEAALEHLRGMLFQTDIPVGTDTRMGKFLGGVKAARDITPLGQTQLPYLKTILNMTKDTIQRVPGLNLISRDVRADLMAGGDKRADAVAKMIMGSSFIGLGVMLSENGYVTTTTDINNYQTDSAAGVKGGSFKIPGTEVYIPLERIEPLGSLLRFGADGAKLTAEVARLRAIIDGMPEGSVDIEDRNTLLSWAQDYSLVMGSLSYKILSEKSGAASIKNLVNAVTSPESDSAQQWINQYTTGFIPLHAGIKQFNEEPHTKEAKNIFEHIRKKLGLMRDKYGDRDTINYLGEVDNDLKRIKHVYWKTSQPKKGDYVMAKLYELQPGFQRAQNELTLPNGAVKELEYKEVYELRTLLNDPDIVGGPVRQQLFTAMMDPEFQALPDGVPGEKVGHSKYTKITALRDIYNKAKENARNLYIERHQKELEKFYDAEIEKSKIGLNVIDRSSKGRSKVMQDFTGR